MPVKKKAQPKEVNLVAVERGQFEACLLGTTPIILNRLSEKARHELLFPSGRKSAAQRQSMLKHEPLDEYRSSPYLTRIDGSPTALLIVAASVKKAMSSIPLDLPDTGTSKAQLERLLFAPQDRVALWGVPQMTMDIVRMADMNRTPDVRTRAIVPQWATKVQIQFVKPVLRQDVVLKLLSAAGFMRGIGDWRAEKGSGSFGCFEVVAPDDPRFLSVVKNGGYKAQMAALETPDFYNEETEELYHWFVEERGRRGFDDNSTKESTKGNGAKKTTKKGKKGAAEITL